MGIAFEFTDEDVASVLQRMGRSSDDADVERLMPLLDGAAVEKAALHGDDLDQQTDYALDEIELQVAALEPSNSPRF